MPSCSFMAHGILGKDHFPNWTHSISLQHIYDGMISAGFVTANILQIPSGMNQADTDISQRLIILIKKKKKDLSIKIGSLIRILFQEIGCE